MSDTTRDHSPTADGSRARPGAQDRTLPIHRTDGYESGYARGVRTVDRFVSSLRSRRTAGEIVVPSELGRIIERAMIRWEAAGGQGMAQRPLAERCAGFETIRGEMHGLSAGLMDALSCGFVRGCR